MRRIRACRRSSAESSGTTTTPRRSRPSARPSGRGRSVPSRSWKPWVLSKPFEFTYAWVLSKPFEFTYEIGWKLLKDYLSYQGIPDISGSRDAVRQAVRPSGRQAVRPSGRQAVRQQLLTEESGALWMNMLQDRNRTSHIYDEKTVRQIEAAVAERYFPELQRLDHTLRQKA